MMSRFFAGALIVVLAVGAVWSPDAAADDDATAGLVEALLMSDSFKVRATAAVALGRVHDRRASAALAAAVKQDQHYAVRAAAAAALGRQGADAGIPPLLAALRDSDVVVQTEARSALQSFHGKEHAPAFREISHSEDSAERLAAVRALGEIARVDNEIGVDLLPFLADDDAAIRAAAATSLDGIPHDRAIPLLLEGLSSSSSQVRSGAARQLAKRTDPRAVMPLRQLILALDEDAEVHQAASEALRQHRDLLDVPGMQRVASTPAPVGKGTERADAIRLLAALRDPAALPSIERGFADPDVAVRAGAARAAVDVGGPISKKLVTDARAKETDERMQKQLDALLRLFRDSH